MAINQLLKRMSDFISVTVRGLVTLRQTFVRRCHGGIVKKNRRVYKPRA
jgi:hypothetical protein